MTNGQERQTIPAAQWVRIPNGTKVRHRHEGYNGHIDGLTEIVTGPNRNPDGKTQYRLNIGGSIRRLATQDDLSIFVDGDDLVIMIRQKEPYRRSITVQLHGVLTEDRFIKAGRSSAVPAVTTIRVPEA
jgi:hypothetical protein